MSKDENIFNYLTTDNEINKSFNEGISSFKATEVFQKCGKFLMEAQECMNKKGENPECLNMFISYSACNMDTIDPSIFDEFTNCLETKGFEECDVEQFETRAMKKLLSNPVVLTNQERQLAKELETMPQPKSESDYFHHLFQFSKKACPSELNSYSSCFNSKAKDYKNCLPEGKALVKCTGRLLSKFTALEMEGRLKEMFGNK